MQPTDVQAISLAIDGLARLPLMAFLTHVRYQFRLFRAGNFPDTDYKRALTGEETAALHNAWMDDAESWMPTITSVSSSKRMSSTAKLGARAKRSRPPLGTGAV